jgi:hypothetical protein
MPSYDTVTKNTALPSDHFPSDHLSIVADLTWKK